MNRSAQRHQRRTVTAVADEDGHSAGSNLPTAGRARSDSAGEVETSGVTPALEDLGIGAGISRKARPDATAAAKASSTFVSPDTMRSRIAGVCTRDSSNRKALVMCCCSTSVWLFQNSVACV